MKDQKHETKKSTRTSTSKKKPFPHFERWQTETDAFVRINKRTVLTRSLTEGGK